MSQTNTTVAPLTVSQTPASAKQLSLLQTRIRDMTTQMDIAIKTLIQENVALRKQNADLIAKQEARDNQ